MVLSILISDIKFRHAGLCRPVFMTEFSSLWEVGNVTCIIASPYNKTNEMHYHRHHHHHLPPWIRSFDLFRHRRIAIFSWGVHGLFFLEVCS